MNGQEAEGSIWICYPKLQVLSIYSLGKFLGTIQEAEGSICNATDFC